MQINSGDIIVLAFWKEAMIYRFEGICMAVKRKSLLKIDTTLHLRNVILGIVSNYKLLILLIGFIF